jgi:transcriptional regulator
VYLPKQFQQQDAALLAQLIDENPFGVVVSVRDGLPYGSHLPLLLERGRGSHGTLWGHMARANPQRAALDAQEVLVIFSGAHSYISPTWYQAAPHVPTWNYVAVHAYGKPREVSEPEEAARVLQQLAARFEPGAADENAKPWRYEELPEEFRARLLKEIAVFSIEMTRLEGKWKLGQNRTPSERGALLAALEARGPEQQRLAAYLRAWYE